MYHIKKLKISAFAFIFSTVIAVIYAGGSIIFFASILTAVYISHNFSLPSYILGDIANAKFLLSWLAILAIVWLGALGLGALIALFYNQFGKVGRGIQMDIELFEEKK